MNSLKYSGPNIITNNLGIQIPSHENYGKYILDKLVNGKNKVALINGDTEDNMTQREMAQQVVNIASALIKLGVGADDVIGVCSENRAEFLTTSIAVMCTDAVVTFINCAYSKEEITHTLNISKPKYIFLSPNTFNSYYNTMNKLDIINKFFIFGPAESNVMSFTELVSTHVNIDSFRPKTFKGAEKTALILYSSGTTGLPKGAKLSHRNLIISGQPLFGKLNEVSLTIAPWTNTIGIMLTLRKLIGNETVVYMNKFSEEKYYNCIEKYKVGFLMVVPPIIVLLNKSHLLAKYDVSSVELVYCGGAPLAASFIEKLKIRLPNLKNVLQGYGMTEASGVITEETTDASRQGSVGKIAGGLIIKVVDVETRKLLGPNKPGEICIKGPSLFQGYIGRDVKEDSDEEIFFKTGDIGYYDEDGYFYVVDRLKELIKYKAWQVAPSELEAILRQHPAVMDAGVIGVPDDSAGELPAAFVVKLPEATVTEKELMDFVKPKVSSWKQLRGGVRFVPEIPKNGSGKILRRKLREMINKPVSKL